MKTLVKFSLLIFIFFIPVNSFCQIKVDFKKKVINQTNTRVNRAADQTVSKGLDAVEDGVKDAVKGDSGNDNKKNQNEEQTAKSSSSGNAKDNTGNKSGIAKNAEPDQPSLQAYSKYDFIPGEKIIFFEDFSQDAVGDFPGLWNTNGSATSPTGTCSPSTPATAT